MLNSINRASKLLSACAATINNIQSADVSRLVTLLRYLFEAKSTLYVFANGGLAAEAVHLWTDMFVPSRTAMLPRTIVPAASGPLITMLINDNPPGMATAAYLQRAGELNDGVLIMSHSGGTGKSIDLVNGANVARDRGMRTLAVTTESHNALATASEQVVVIGNPTLPPPVFEVAVAAYLHAALEEMS